MYAPNPSIVNPVHLYGNKHVSEFWILDAAGII